MVLFVFSNANAQDSKFLHFDLTIATGVPFVWGVQTKEVYIGASIMPEFRIRILPGDEPLNIFGAIGYSGVNSLFNPAENADSSSITASPFSDIPVYFSIGVVFNVSSEAQERSISNIRTGITNILLGIGYMNSKVGTDGSNIDIYDAGPFFYFGVATTALSFGFY